MMGMVVSFIGGLLLLPLAGVSVNMISLFGFLVVLGHRGRRCGRRR